MKWIGILVAGCLLVAVAFGLSGCAARSTYVAFQMSGHEVTVLPMVFCISEDKADKPVQVYAVGWYEYQITEKGAVVSVFEDRGMVLDKRTVSQGDGAHGALFKASTQPAAGDPCAMPAALAGLAGGGATFRGTTLKDLGQDFTEHVGKPAGLKYRTFPARELGLIATRDDAVKDITIGVGTSGTELIMVSFSDGKTLYLIKVRDTNEVMKLYAKQ